jgi:cytochrome c-type biogenesis protein CcmH
VRPSSHARCARRRLRRGGPVAAALLLAVCLALGSAPARAAGAEQPRTSLPQIERQVMCVTCKIPLNVAESTQADRERAFIQSLIDRGESEAQIKQSLVEEYGASVLGLPADHGFDAAAYLVPLAAVLALAATLLVLLPRWRRRARLRSAALPAPPPLAPDDAARLDTDLARFD